MALRASCCVMIGGDMRKWCPNKLRDEGRRHIGKSPARTQQRTTRAFGFRLSYTALNPKPAKIPDFA